MSRSLGRWGLCPQEPGELAGVFPAWRRQGLRERVSGQICPVGSGTVRPRTEGRVAQDGPRDPSVLEGPPGTWTIWVRAREQRAQWLGAAWLLACCDHRGADRPSQGRPRPHSALLLSWPLNSPPALTCSLPLVPSLGSGPLKCSAATPSHASHVGPWCRL